MKISELTFEGISSKLGKNHFSMHYDASDALMDIYNSFAFERAKKNLMSKFGDVEVTIHPEAEWYDNVRIEDEKWKEASKAYIDEKAAWCAKYGCD